MRESQNTLNGAARTSRLIVTGRNLANRELSACQRAALVELTLRGAIDFQPCRNQLTHIMKASATYVGIAQSLPSSELFAIAFGKVSISFAALMAARKWASAREVIVPTDDELDDVARTVGPDRMLNAAARVEGARQLALV